jgi:glycosyltransferase involved in cell wall biosynthesis
MKNNIDWLIVVPNDRLGGGAEQLLMNLADYLSESGEHCAIYFLNSKSLDGWKYMEDRCKLIYSPFPNYFLGYIASFFFLIKFSKRNSIKHTLSSQTLINALLGFTKRIGLLKETKVIVRESNSIFHLLNGLKLLRYKIAYQIGYSKVDLLICQTEFMKNQLLEEIPWMKKKLKVIVQKNPINLELVKSQSLKKNKISNENEFIVAAGRLVPAKAFDVLIYSFNEIKDQFPELELWILGEGPEKEPLQTLINDLNLHKRVKLMGFSKNPFPYFKKARMGVLSSRIEGFPNVLLQMMTLNTNVVSTISAGGIDKIKGIYTCEIENVKALAATMEKCLTTNNFDNREEFDIFLNGRTIKGFLEVIAKELV